MHRFASALAVLALAACAGSGPAAPFDALVGSPGVVTLTNLHPDEQRSRLFAANYQQDGLVPVCSSVTLLDRNRKRLVFSVQKTGKTYEYYHHEKAAAEPFPDHLARYFGTTCPLDDAKLGEVDRRGIAEGKTRAGMSKAAVVLALGHPPPHATPSLDADRWIYWKNRFDRMAVVFRDGRVAGIEE